MSQGRGQRIFSARSRPPGPFQPFCHAPKTGIFTRQGLKKHTIQPRSTPTGHFFKKRYKNAVLATFSANGLCVACPSTTKLPLGSPQGKPVNISSVNPFPAAPPVETFRYRPDRQSKGPHPSRLRRPGPRLDFAAPGRLARGIDGRLRRGKVFGPEYFAATANR